MQKLDLKIRRGSTIALPIRIETATWRSVPVTGIARAIPVRITAPEHGLAERWRAAVLCAGGMTEINAQDYPPSDAELRHVTVVDADTVEFNDVSSACFRAYTSGGHLVFPEPLDLSLFSEARMEVRNRVGGELLTRFGTADGTLEIDVPNKTLWLRISALDSAKIAFDRGVFDIELVTPGDEVKAVCASNSTLTVQPEVTTEH